MGYLIFSLSDCLIRLIVQRENWVIFGGTLSYNPTEKGCSVVNSDDNSQVGRR